MFALFLIMASVFFTVSVFLIARFGIAKKESSDYVSEEPLTRSVKPDDTLEK